MVTNHSLLKGSIVFSTWLVIIIRGGKKRIETRQVRRNKSSIKYLKLRNFCLISFVGFEGCNIFNEFRILFSVLRTFNVVYLSLAKIIGHNRQGLISQKGFLTFCLKLLYYSQSLSFFVLFFYDRRDRVPTLTGVPSVIWG